MNKKKLVHFNFIHPENYHNVPLFYREKIEAKDSLLSSFLKIENDTEFCCQTPINVFDHIVMNDLVFSDEKTKKIQIKCPVCEKNYTVDKLSWESCPEIDLYCPECNEADNLDGRKMEVFCDCHGKRG